jgi:hypothetical protein
MRDTSKMMKISIICSLGPVGAESQPMMCGIADIWNSEAVTKDEWPG